MICINSSGYWAQYRLSATNVYWQHIPLERIQNQWSDYWVKLKLHLNPCAHVWPVEHIGDLLHIESFTLANYRTGCEIQQANVKWSSSDCRHSSSLLYSMNVVNSINISCFGCVHWVIEVNAVRKPTKWFCCMWWVLMWWFLYTICPLAVKLGHIFITHTLIINDISEIRQACQSVNTEWKVHHALRQSYMPCARQLDNSSQALHVLKVSAHCLANISCYVHSLLSVYVANVLLSFIVVLLTCHHSTIARVMSGWSYRRELG